MVEQARTLQSIQRRGARVDGWARDLADEPEVAVVDDVQTTTGDVECHDDRKMVAETEVTHHSETNAWADMKVNP